MVRDSLSSIPASHEDLLERPLDVVMTTEMDDGRLQSTVVWFSRDGQDVLVNTMREFQKARNLHGRPRATLLVAEPPDASRWIEIRGTVTLHEEGALGHLNALARAYDGVDRYFGGCVAADLAEVEHPLICRIHPAAVAMGPRQIPAAAARISIPVSSARRSCDVDAPIPASDCELLGRPLLAAFSTRLASGAQTNPTWFDLDGSDVLVNTTLERAKGRNLVRDPRATVLVVDPDDTGRWIEIRGDVDLETGPAASEHLDRLTRRYTAHPSYYGHVYEEDRKDRETRVIARIHPRHVNRNAIHS
jgi:PPOX class probable F420-dependent enzyme